MPTKIFKNPIEVGNRLEELGLSRDKLVDVVDAMVGARAGCTDNDPPGARGWSSWRMGTRRLREVLLVEEGWSKDETDQISSVLNRSLGIRVAVSNTDEDTGIDDDDRIPQNRSKKGLATDRAVHANQMSFMDVLDASMKVIRLNPRAKGARPIIIWYLCVYCEGDQFRAELSCPDGLEEGYFTDFVERILLIGSDDNDGGGSARRRTDNDGDDSGIDIPVMRKSRT